MHASPKSSTKSPRDDSAGFVVMGMHRSGTSALAHLLQEAGANLGERLVPGSLGNEEGHWEDAFAVETNERLLAGLGYSWDDVRPLPRDWMSSESAVRARSHIREYLRASRLKQPLWAIKDPRMCLVADVWLAAMEDVGFSPVVILLGRHPAEVAESLATRDGMAQGKAIVSWARHMLSAEKATRGVKRTYVSYGELLRKPAALLERLRRLPGGNGLLPPSQLASPIDAIIRPSARHHTAHDIELPAPIDALWAAIEGLGRGDSSVDGMQRLSVEFERAESMYGPVLGELARQQEMLWKRTARAEAALADRTANEPQASSLVTQLGDSFSRVMDQLVAVETSLERISSAHGDDVDRELHRLQEEHARAIETASKLSAEVGMARDISPRMENLSAGITSLGSNVIEAISTELRRMQEEYARVLESASALSTEAALARNLAPRMTMLESGLVHMGERLMQVYNKDLRAALERVDARDAELDALRLDHAQELLALRGERESLTAELEAVRLEHASEISALKDQIEKNLAELTQSRLKNAEADARLSEVVSELKRVERQMPALRYDAEMLRRVRASTSWKMTRPMRFARRFLLGQLLESDKTVLQNWWLSQLTRTRLVPPTFRRMALAKMGRQVGISHQPESGLLPATVAGAAPFLPLDAQVQGKADVFVWAVIDWHFRTQRPQHLARGLAAAGHRVFYLSNNMTDSEVPGFEIQALDQSGRLFQVNLNAAGAPPIYFGSPSSQTAAQLRRSIGELMDWADSDGGICIVQHPFWSEVASSVSGTSVLYDCMDHHAGFDDNARDVLAAEAELTANADLVIVTSQWLSDELADANPCRALIRNAAEFDHFCDPPAKIYHDQAGRKIIGYYGAIAEWFDIELVRAVATSFPDSLVLLIGNDTVEAARQLQDLENVEFTGEVPYAKLPFYLHAFDVALLPFRIIPLTLATNPVKVYEYLSAGKPVVSVDLPEMAQFGELVARARDQESFVTFVGQALLAGADHAAVDARKAFARQQTWAHRAEELDGAIARIDEPRVSVIVLTFNNLEITKACLHSLDVESNWPNLEVIAVDNASSDGTPAFLRQWAESGANRRAILNSENLGFSAGNNVGLAAATGDYLILLNNDTYVTPNWIRTLVNHLKRDPGIGIIGPVTNNIGNEARIDIHYSTMEEMKRAAASYTRRHLGHVFDLRTVAFFCVGLRRSVYEEVGPLDEAFGVGFFEDDDYCRRIERAGLRVVCADDVFVHHHLSASFNALKAEKKQELFLRNKRIYENKWGEWTPHAYRAAVGSPANKGSERVAGSDSQP